MWRTLYFLFGLAVSATARIGETLEDYLKTHEPDKAVIAPGADNTTHMQDGKRVRVTWVEGTISGEMYYDVSPTDVKRILAASAEGNWVEKAQGNQTQYKNGALNAALLLNNGSLTLSISDGRFETWWRKEQAKAIAARVEKEKREREKQGKEKRD